VIRTGPPLPDDTHRVAAVVFCGPGCDVDGPHAHHQHVIASCACGASWSWRPEEPHSLDDVLLDVRGAAAGYGHARGRPT
jgi:hypothetical protein